MIASSGSFIARVASTAHASFKENVRPSPGYPEMLPFPPLAEAAMPIARFTSVPELCRGQAIDFPASFARPFMPARPLMPGV